VIDVDDSGLCMSPIVMRVNIGGNIEDTGSQYWAKRG